MSEVDANFTEIQALHPNAALHSEGGHSLVLLPNFMFRAGAGTVQMNLLLHPAAHSGYVTRLFFEKKLEGVGASKNWTEHIVLGRQWWAPSWNNVVVEQSWTSMLGAHLRAVA